MVLHRPVELAPFHRWDEKAGLRRDAIRSQWSTRLKRNRSRSRDHDCSQPPTRIRTSRATACGSGDRDNRRKAAATSEQSSAACDPKGRGHSGYAWTAYGARAALLGIETGAAPGWSWAPRNSACVHAPPLAATYLVRGWVRAGVAEAQRSPRSASTATFCVSFAAEPCTFHCSSSSRRYA